MSSFKWVKKIVSLKDWKNKYQPDNAYTFLEKRGGEVVMAFLSTDPSDECTELDDEEARKVDKHRRATNRRPFPLEDEVDINDILARS